MAQKEDKKMKIAFKFAAVAVSLAAFADVRTGNRPRETLIFQAICGCSPIASMGKGFLDMSFVAFSENK